MTTKSGSDQEGKNDREDLEDSGSGDKISENVDPDRPHRKPSAPGMRSVLDSLAYGDPTDTLALRDVVNGLGRSTFGVLLFLASLPAFIPIPGLAGALSGPLVVLVGLQILILLPNPWLPGFIARRGPLRSTVIRFDRMLSPWLRRMEKMIRPRLLSMVDHRLATIFTGLQLVLLGVLLSLPIPLTNFLFAGLLMVYALALLERDGILMLIAWAMGSTAIGIFGVLSGNLVAWAWAWLEKIT